MFKLPLAVSRNITIEKPIAPILQTIANFKTWPTWSPWACQDKAMQLNYFGEDGAIGSGYRWTSQWLGEGQLQLKEQTDDALTMHLEFYKPWRSEAKVVFNFIKLSDISSQASWNMQSSLPFFLFFMKATMQAFIGMDYQRGLTMLKDYLETGNVLTDTEVGEVIEAPGIDYVGVRRTCQLADIGPDMQTGCGELIAKFEQSGLQQIAPPFAIYHDWNVKTGQCDYTFAIPVAPGQNINIENLVHSSRAPVKALKIIHTGDYKHLGNAWAAGYSRLQNNKELKANKKQAAFEVYINDPSQTAPKDLRTEVFIPVL